MFGSATNGFGWGVGNIAYSGDRDILIHGFQYIGGAGAVASGCIVVGYGASNVVIESCNIVSESGGIRLDGPASNVDIRGCTLTRTGSGGTGISANVATGLYPSNITIRDNRISVGQTGSATGVSFEATGSVVIKGNEISGNIAIYGASAVSPYDLRVEDNLCTIYNTPTFGIGIATSATYVPTRTYNIVGNVLSGAASTGGLYIGGSLKLRMMGNRAADCSAPWYMSGAFTTEAILNAGGKVEDNGYYNLDRASSRSTHTISADTGNSKFMFSATLGVWRWGFGGNGATESGSNAGSDFEVRSYSDAGSYVDSPIYVSRPSTGSIQLARPTVYAGSSGLAADQQVVFRAATGRNRSLVWQTGTVDRWKLRTNSSAESGSNVGSDFSILSYDDAGTLIDTPVSITRAANGTFTLARPFTTSSGRTVATQNITASAGTTVLGIAVDAAIVTGSTTHTLTLPAAATGRRLFLKNRSTGTVTVNRAGSDTIDGGTTFNLTAGQGTILIVNNSTDWCRVANA
jgi:hypothetical protein